MLGAQKRGFGFVILSAITIVVGGCQTKTPMRTMALSSVKTANHAEILRHVPIGTAAAQAQSTMEANGFKCSRENDENGEYISCDLQEEKSQFVTQRWQVKLYLEKESVVQADISYGTIGL